MSCHNYEQQKQSRSIITPKDKSTFPGKNCSFFIVSLSKGLSLCFTCSAQHVKYRMPRGFPVTSSLLLDCHVKQYIHTSINSQLDFLRLWPSDYFLMFIQRFLLNLSQHSVAEQKFNIVAKILQIVSS